MLKTAAALSALIALSTLPQTITGCVRAPTNDQRRAGQRPMQAGGIATVNPQPGRGLTHLLKCWWRDGGSAWHPTSLLRFGRLRKERDLVGLVRFNALHLAHGHINLRSITNVRPGSFLTRASP